MSTEIPELVTLRRENARLAAEVAMLKDALADRELEARRQRDEHHALRSSEKRYRSLFENMSSGFVLFAVVVDAHRQPVDLTIVAANAQFGQTTGLDVDAVVGRRLTDVLPGIEEDDAAWIQTYGRVATSGGAVQLDRPSDLLGRHFSVWAYQPEPDLCAVYFVDITDKLETQRSLRKTEELFSKSFHASPLALSITGDGDGRFIEVNQAFIDLFGVSREEVAGRRATELGLLEVPERNRVVGAHQESGGVHGLELVGRTRQGRSLDLVAYSSELDAGTGDRQITHLVDVTERNAVARALVASEARYRTLFDQAPDAILIVDMTQTIQEANELGCRLFGYSRETFSGNITARDLVLPDQLDAQAAAFQRVFAGERVVVRRRFRRRDGSVFSGELIACRIDDDHILAIVRDRTQVLEAERERQRLERKLHVSQRLEAIGLLAGGVAHDFNNMLTVILSYTDFALDQMESTDPVGEAISEVYNAGKRASRLTRQLLAFSRKQVIKPVELDLNQTARDLERMLARILGEDIAFHHKLDPTLRHVRADPGQVEQVVMNLVVNARDAMPQGGHLTIETANVELDASFVSTRGSVRPGAYVMLAVTDTGTGISESTLDHIFEPFFTTKEVSRGTGLGLSTVFGIVSQSGGAIRVRSALGAGTRFEVYLPRTERTGHAPAEQRLAAVPPAQGETILVVEDDQAVRRVVVHALRRAGYRVLEAASGIQALSLVQAQDPQLDLLVTDVVMPNMSGKELAKRLTDHHPALRVLFMSGYLNASTSGELELDPSAHLLSKPFGIEVLYSAVHAALDPADG